MKSCLDNEHDFTCLGPPQRKQILPPGSPTVHMAPSQAWLQHPVWTVDEFVTIYCTKCGETKELVISRSVRAES